MLFRGTITRLALAFSLLLFTASGAAAAPIWIDFTAAEWQTNPGINTSSASVSIGDLIITAESSSLWGDVQVGATGDGLGVVRGTAPGHGPQISLGELLTVSFSRPVIVENFAVSRLADPGCYWRHFCDDGEFGAYTIDGGAKAIFGPGDANHEHVEVVGVEASSITFRTPWTWATVIDGYTLSGISVSDVLEESNAGTASVPTPEPGAALLFGAGLVACGVRARRRSIA